jgi:pimeloyl-ACP methyl ester carboxylesterase
MPIQAALVAAALASATTGSSLETQSPLPPHGRLVDLGGYRLHLLSLGPRAPGRPLVVFSAGGGDFATDWMPVLEPLSDSLRVCSYDRPGFGWSEPGPWPRTSRQEAFELHLALERAGERGPYILVGHSLGAFVAREFADAYRPDVAAVVLIEPANENGMMGYRGQWVLPRSLATQQPIPPPRRLADAPPVRDTTAEGDSCRARAARMARIWRPYDRLGAAAQRYRIWALGHPACIVWRGDLFAEEMAAVHAVWARSAHPLDSLPVTVIMGRRHEPPPGLSEAQFRADSARIDLTRLSSRGRLVADSLSGHHVQLENPPLVVRTIRQVAAQVSGSFPVK